MNKSLTIFIRLGFSACFAFSYYTLILSLCNTNKLESVRFIMKETVQGNDTDDPGSRSRCRRVVFTGKSDLPVLSLQARGGF
jgi:hypothetical protein